jgi:UDP-N-acetylmuramyl pentapeptide synthase
MRHLYEALPAAKRGRWAESAEELIRRQRGLIDAGDVVLVKGSLPAGSASLLTRCANWAIALPDRREGGS